MIVFFGLPTATKVLPHFRPGIDDGLCEQHDLVHCRGDEVLLPDDNKRLALSHEPSAVFPDCRIDNGPGLQRHERRVRFHVQQNIIEATGLVDL